MLRLFFVEAVFSHRESYIIDDHAKVADCRPSEVKRFKGWTLTLACKVLILFRAIPTSSIELEGKIRHLNEITDTETETHDCMLGFERKDDFIRTLVRVFAT